MIGRWFAWVFVPALAAAQDSVPPAPVHPHRPHHQHAAAPTDSAVRDSVLRTRWSAIAAEPVPTTALLPSHRIVAFYGNPMSKRMGVLGAYPVDTMLAHLDEKVAEWQSADSATPVVPALHLIAVVAQGGPGGDGKYRARMPDTLVERVYSWAARRNALVFLDIQPGKSTVEAELPRLAPFLSRPNVHLALDPEFAMSKGGLPGKRIGTIDAADVNYAIKFLSGLVGDSLPPKILVIHRFRRPMLTHADQIVLDPRVQVVIDMDGFGTPSIKFGSYRKYVYASPVQFTGWKQFFRQDVPHTAVADILKLTPVPVYIQYQ
ncbi:MAG TPA: hypothetical protein VNV25_00130 [Gemmatimonadaceae bacterium]|nr:hypothetical protein [Gemmatimonadaceae bacterium]